MWPVFILLGLLAGIAGGFFGIGGGIVLVPALTLLFHMNQHQAQGTVLATLIPPIGLLAVWRYYQHGDVNIYMAVFLALGFIVGGLIGANLALKVPATLLKKVFAVFLIAVALKMFWEK